MCADNPHCDLVYEQPDDVTTTRLAVFLGIATNQGIKPMVPEVMPFVRALYDIHCAGGSLHIVLDDQNVKDCDVEFCEQWARDHNDQYGEMLAKVLRMMSRTQRLRLATEKYLPVGSK